MDKIHIQKLKAAGLVVLLLAAWVSLAAAQSFTVSPQLPAIPTNIFVVTNYGAVGDGISTNTAAINAAIIDACVTHSGGTVEIPYVPGTSNIFLSGPIQVNNYLNLQVDAGVTLRMLPYGSYSGGDFIADTTGSHAYHDIEVSGHGTIDGQATLAGWWSISSTSGKPYMMNFYHGAQILIRDITLTRSPVFHIKFNGSSCTNITVTNLTIATDSSDSHNTDGIDVAGQNILIENSSISDGDYNIAVSGNCSDIIVTNCAFGAGHGMSVGGNTSPGGVSNLLVINCTFTNTDNGIRLKADVTEGGPVQNCYYYNNTMTNVNKAAVIIYSYYVAVPTPTSVSPATAAGEPVAALNNTPSWQNIIISNLTANVTGSGIAGIIWGRTELPETNIILSHVNLTAAKTFDVYNAYGVQFVDSTITTTTSGQKTFTLWNASFTLTNSAPVAGPVTVDGLTSTNNSLALYNSPAFMTTPDLFGCNPLAISGGILTNSGNLTLSNSVQDFFVGTNTGRVMELGNLSLNDVINITNAPGFTTTNYTLFTYSGSLTGTPLLGSTPAGFNCTLDTNTPGYVLLDVAPATPPPSPLDFSTFSLSGNNLVFSGTGGVTNGTYIVLASTNVALPLIQWTPLATNSFDASGDFTFTNATTNFPQLFYRLELQ
jgi:polygalacturonase